MIVPWFWLRKYFRYITKLNAVIFIICIFVTIWWLQALSRGCTKKLCVCTIVNVDFYYLNLWIAAYIAGFFFTVCWQTGFKLVQLLLRKRTLKYKHVSYVWMQRHWLKFKYKIDARYLICNFPHCQKNRQFSGNILCVSTRETISFYTDINCCQLYFIPFI